MGTYIILNYTTIYTVKSVLNAVPLIAAVPPIDAGGPAC